KSISFGCRTKSVAFARRSSRISRDRRRSFGVLRSCSRRMPMGRDGRMSRSPRPSTAGCRRSRIFASGWSPRALSWLWTARNARTKRKIEYWVIPPEQDAEFVACMEEVLETYAEAYDPRHPVLCMDEQPVQLLKETRVPIAATKQHGRRVDYEYERHGTASIFMFAEPLSGCRQATARVRRTKADWAIEVAQMLDTRYADCAEVILVCDNLNTHT